MLRMLPKPIELQRLIRLREAALGKSDRSKMVPDPDWLADLEDRISALERGLGLEKRQAA